MTKERREPSVFLPFLAQPQLHFQDGGDTWKTINKTVACCFLLRPVGVGVGGGSSEGDRSLGVSVRAVMIQIDVANQEEGDRRDITSPEVSP